MFRAFLRRTAFDRQLVPLLAQLRRREHVRLPKFVVLRPAEQLADLAVTAAVSLAHQPNIVRPSIEAGRLVAWIVRQDAAEQPARARLVLRRAAALLAAFLGLVLTLSIAPNLLVGALRRQR